MSQRFRRSLASDTAFDADGSTRPLLVMGGTVVDVILPEVPRLPAWPRRSHSESTRSNLALLGEPPIVTLGGNGANAAYVAACCGADVTLHTSLADDALGRLARNWLHEVGCRLVLASSSRATAVNIVAANARMERAMFFYPGSPPKFSTTRGEPEPSVLLVTGWPHPSPAAMARVFARNRRDGSFTALDSGPILGVPWTLRGLRAVFAELDLLLANEFELQAITGERRLDAAVASLRRHYAGHLVLKCGAQGAWWLPHGETTARRFPGRRVRARNTVGAGDSFNGALLAAIAAGAGFAEAIPQACAIAASVVASPRGVLGVRTRGSVAATNRRSFSP